MKKILFKLNKKTYRLAVKNGYAKNFLRERFFYYLSASCLNLRDLL
jgi:ribosomal protein L9